MGAYADEVDHMTTEIANTEMAAAWDGHEGDVWTDQADRYDRANRFVAQRFHDAQLVRPDDDVLDIGCGTGATTRAVARTAAAGTVTGVDLSTRMLALARQRSAEQGLDNVTFVRGDAQVFPFEPAAYDLAMSSFGVMFFNDPIAAFTNIARAVRPGGRLALLAWRSLPENDWLMSLRGALAVGRDLPQPPPDAPTPFALADPDRVRRILAAAGFAGVELAPIDDRVELGTDTADALDFARSMGVVEGLTEDLDAGDRAKAWANLAELFAACETPEGVQMPCAAWLITARR